jgi:hypothetical protein
MSTNSNRPESKWEERFLYGQWVKVQICPPGWECGRPKEDEETVEGTQRRREGLCRRSRRAQSSVRAAIRAAAADCRESDAERC